MYCGDSSLRETLPYLVEKCRRVRLVSLQEFLTGDSIKELTAHFFKRLVDLFNKNVL